MLAFRKHITGAAALAVVASALALLPATPAQAAGAGLVINEVYGGGGNGGSVYQHDFIELRNTSASPISLSGKSLQYRGATSTGDPTVGNTFALPDVMVQAGKTFLVRAAAGASNTGTLPTPDHIITLAIGGSSGQLLLANQTTPIASLGVGPISNAAVIDFVGWGGASTTSYEGTAAAAATANSTSTSRNASGADSDNNSTDFTTGVPSPTNSTAGGGDPEPTATNPGNKSAFQNQPIAGFTLAATGGTAPYHWTATGLPGGVTVADDGAVSGTPTAAGTFSVTATVTDSAGTPASDDVQFTITVNEPPALKTIAEVQGDGDRSPFAPATGTGLGDETIEVQGVVTGMYPDVPWGVTGSSNNSGFDGMYIQTAGTGGATDATEGQSDAIFIYGNNSMPAGVEVGDSVSVIGRVSEFSGTTEITPGAGGVTELGSPLAPVSGLAIAYPATEAEREAQEGMLLAPTNTFTVTNVYDANQYGEIGLASGTTPLKQPTEHAAPGDLTGIQAIHDENLARGVILDDGAGVNYMSNQTIKGHPVPYLTDEAGDPHSVRVGAEAEFPAPVILEYRFGGWRFQPSSQVTTNGADVVSFEDTRATNAAPQNVGGDLTMATFNVLNYFNTTGEAYAAAGPQQNPPLDTRCTYYTDRAGNRIGNNSCGVQQLDDPDTATNEANSNDGRGPRGAATAASLARQEAKLGHTLNTLDADIIGLEEVENSIKLPGETNRDDALARIVAIANADAGDTKWAYVKSPGSATTAAAVGEQDVIRGAFMYQVDSVDPVGQSRMLFGTTEFANAREPLAQAFKAAGAPDDDAFAVIVNHFKSKGDNQSPAPPASGDNQADDFTGVGAFNGDRVRQAERLVEFADEFAADRDIAAVFLAGDFNSYTMEEPIKALEEGGFELVESDQPNDESYSYDGRSGSLDHVLGNEAAMEMVTGADIWEINANESIAFQYSRYNYNVTDFWQPELPFATSDHNPEIVGIDVPDFDPVTYKEIQVLGTNDFHGRLLPDGGNAAGAAPFATAVKELETENPNSIFVAAGDLVGASTFESFIQKDNPTIDALNAMGLEVSAAGNHEFDRGYDDFVGRIQDRAAWEYIAANVVEPDGADELAETFTKTIDGVEIGFVGAVTEDLLGLVSPDGMEGVSVTDVVDATNAAAADLKADGADLVVLLVHEGAPTTDCSSPNFTDEATTWGNIVQNTSADVDAIISGHTHLAYNCRYPVAAWSDREVTKRPVVSAGQYGTNLNQLVFKYDGDELVAVSQDVIATAGVGYAADPTVQDIVDDAVDYAETEGSVVLGKMDGPFQRALYTSSAGPIENRGGESTLGNQVAEVQRWATDEAGIETDIAFMNPGGLRADMTGVVNGGVRDLTYRGAADVQPFANTLVNMELTGAQIEKVLEQQWQRTAQGGVPSRPFLRLGVSDGFTYTYDETPVTVNAPNSAPVNTFEGEITGMWLDGEPIEPTTLYSVTVNSFLGTGGDNFWELANGTQKVDSGVVDLEAMVDYMAQYDVEPLEVDFGQRAVEVTFPGGAPDVYNAGDTVTFTVGSWAMSGAGDVHDDTIEVLVDGETVDSAPVNNDSGNKPYDSYGTASVEFQVPADARGNLRVTLVGEETGTEIPVDIAVDERMRTIQVLATNDFHGRIPQTASNGEAGAAVLAGAVKQLRAANPDTVFAAAGDLIGASTFDSFSQHDKPTIDALNEAGLDVSAVGNHELDQGYSDLIDRVMAEYDEENNEFGGAEWEYIAANLKMKGTGEPAVPATFVQDFGDFEIGFVGAVTEELPSLVRPDGIADLDVLDIVDTVNEEATELRADGIDAVVLLIHEGSPGTACAGQNTPGSTWGDIVTGVNADVDAIVSGHTHKAYDCKFPVAEWADRSVTERPVVSAGQYGMFLNQLEFTFDEETSELVSIDQALLPLMTSGVANYPVDQDTKDIVDAAVTEASEIGNQVLGQIAAPFSRAKYSNGTENRGSSSTAGNMIAEVQRWATPESINGGADIAFMNPGGIREDMVGSGTGAYPRDLTYRQAANVQSFANSLINMDLTGAQIKKVLEQQWQRNASGGVPTRAFLRLGVSDGFKYTYKEIVDPSGLVPAGTKKGVVTGMWLDDEPIDLDATYSVTVNSFLAPGGDNFFELGNGTNKADWGKTDLAAMVDYFAEFGAGGNTIAPDYSQRAVEVAFPGGAPRDYYVAGGVVEFDLAGLAMTGSAAGVSDLQDDELAIWLNDEQVGTATVDNTVGSAATNNTTVNNAGKASVSVELPDDIEPGDYKLFVAGETGTEIVVPITVDEAPPTPTTTPTSTTAAMAPMTYGTDGSIAVTVSPSTASGSATVFAAGTNVGTGAIINGSGTVVIDGQALEPGSHTLTVRYGGSATHDPSQTTLTVVVSKAATSLSATAATVEYGADATINVTATPNTAAGAITASAGGNTLGSGSLTAGAGSITIPGTALDPGTHTITVRYDGDSRHAGATTTVSLTVNEPEPATTPSVTSASASPGSILVKRGRATIAVSVTAGSVDPTGRVVAIVGGKRVDSATLRNGTATLRVGPFKRQGQRSIEVRYLGTDGIEPSSTTTSVDVVGEGSRIVVKHRPNKVRVNKTKATLTVTVRSDEGRPTGSVEVKIPGQANQTVRLERGRAVIRLAAFDSVGKKVLTITYDGNDDIAGNTTQHTINVVR